jgi:hypothetical protein
MFEARLSWKNSDLTKTLIFQNKIQPFLKNFINVFFVSIQGATKNHDLNNIDCHVMAKLLNGDLADKVIHISDRPKP